MAGILDPRAARFTDQFADETSRDSFELSSLRTTSLDDKYSLTVASDEVDNVHAVVNDIDDRERGL